MSDEPKKLIEAHLEALAAQRRQAAGGVFELEAATQRTLLAEVRRVHGLNEATAPIEAEIFRPLLPAATPVTSEPMEATAPEEAEALRRDLQAETPHEDEPAKIASPREDEGLSAWRMLWTRLAFSFGSVALVGLAAFIIRMQFPAEREGSSFAKLSAIASDKSLPIEPEAEGTRSKALADASKNTDALLRLDEAKPAAPLLAANDAAAPMPATAPAGRSSLRPEPAPVEKSLAASGIQEKAKDATAAPASAPANIPDQAAVPSAPESAVKKTDLAESKATVARQKNELAQAERRQAAPRPLATAAATATSPTTAGALGGAAAPLDLPEGTFVQREVQSGMRRNIQSPPKPEVLTSFRLVPQGDTVRLIDKDGSVYVGRRIASGSTVRFTATGINVTLDQSVTVEAVLIPGTAEGTPLLRGQVRLGARRSWQFEAEIR